ncbi:MAG TPA: tetratricopeptide repeat protein [Terriglobales bacterium]|nr:tetratricopeptide repeat protein [Terriglobales bacterium]
MLRVWGSLLALSSLVFGQTAARAPQSAGGAAMAQKAITLAQSGHCDEALPLLKKSIRQIPNADLRKQAALTGVNCAMTHNAHYDALEFLTVLSRDFPRDPEALYAATHAYSDLSLRASQDLAREAPFSYQVHLLNAEALELQGKWDEAATEYRKILDINPLLPGIHARLGRALLSRQQPPPEIVAQAKKNFEQELDIDPRNATAEYVVGQLAQDANDLSSAIRHFTRATKIDTGFSEAYLGLGTALVSAKRFAEAIPPLESYEKMAPDSPTGHYQLALAYTGVGRKEDANRQAALQRETAESLEKVRRRVAEGLLQQQGQGSQSSEPH